MLCRAGQLDMYSYAPTKHEGSVELPGEYTFIVASSGVIAEKVPQAEPNWESFLGIPGWPKRFSTRRPFCVYSPGSGTLEKITD